MSKFIVVDGWNMFSYDGLDTDTETLKTIAVKSIGGRNAIIKLDTTSFKFILSREIELKNDEENSLEPLDFDRISHAMYVADYWFEDD